jgi:hypothetical protein
MPMRKIAMMDDQNLEAAAVEVLRSLNDGSSDLISYDNRSAQPQDQRRFAGRRSGLGFPDRQQVIGPVTFQ